MSQTMKTLNGYEIVDNYARTQITAEKAALKQEIATERKRIDALASLPEGSTAGDAELVDAHIDYTGKNWESTGAHIRGVTSQLSEQIDTKVQTRIGTNIFDEDTMVEIGSYWYKANAKVGDVVTRESNEYTSFYGSLDIPIDDTNSQLIIYPNKNATNSYYSYFVDENYKVVTFDNSSSGHLIGLEGKVYDIPKGAKRFLINFNIYKDNIAKDNRVMVAYGNVAKPYEEYHLSHYVKNVESETIDELREDVDNNHKQLLEMDKEVFDISERPIYKGSESYLYTTSTFSGWISDYVADEDMKITKFLIPIKARANGVSRVRCYYGKGSFVSDVATIVEEVVVDIKPNTQGVVEFGSYVEIKKGENFFVGYACDDFCDMVSVANNEHSYGGSCYMTNGAFPSPNYFINKSYDVTAKLSVYCKVKESRFGKSSGQHDNIKLVLPKKIDLVVGETFELFYKGILNAIYPENYDFEFSFSNTLFNAKSYKRKLLWTPNESGTANTIVTVRNDNGDVVDKQTLTFHIHSIPNSPTTKKVVLCVGDSLTTNGEWVTEFYRRLTGTGGNPSGYGLSNIQFIGTKGNNGAKYVGDGGWQFCMYNAKSESADIQWIVTNHTKTSADQHSVYADSNGTQWKLETIESGKIKLIRTSGMAHTLTSGTLTWVSGGSEHSNIIYTSSEIASGNPFWNESTGKVDFTNFATSQGVNSIDHCMVLLGWNDTSTPYETYKSQVCTFLDNILSAFPNCKITLLGLQVPSRDGFGENYGVRWNYYEKLQAVWKIQRLYEEICSETKYANNVEFAQVSSQFDTDYNHQKAERSVNTRNTTTEVIQTNGVHPATSGYLQISDVATRNFVARV